MNPLTLSQLIQKLTLALSSHGNVQVYIETKDDEFSIDSVSSHHIHSDKTQPVVVCLGAKKE